MRAQLGVTLVVVKCHSSLSSGKTLQGKYVPFIDSVQIEKTSKPNGHGCLLVLGYIT